MIQDRPRARRAPRGQRASVAFFAACAALLALACSREADFPARRVDEVVQDLLFEIGGWSVLEEAPGHAPSVRSLTTSFDAAVDGDEKYALVMPPPCAVELALPPPQAHPGPFSLHASAGVGARVLLPEGARCTVVFTVEIDGRVAHEERVALQAGQPEAERAWRPIGGADGVALSPGARVVLRTALEGCDAALAPEIAAVGFGALRVERRSERVPERASPDEPSVLLVVVDTLRADHLSCLGSQRARTPSADALAARGVLFEQAYATSAWTWPSTASILTGLAPERHGVLDGGACVLSGENETLAEALLRQGFVTAGFSGNPLIDGERRFGQGFESFDSADEFRFTSALAARIRDWIAAHAGQRFFLYLHLVDPHAAYDNRPEALAQVGPRPDDYPGGNGLKHYEKKLFENEGRADDGTHDLARVVPSEHQRWLRDEYLAGVLTADLWLGEILAQLDGLGLTDDTLVALTSDHGEELGDHGLLAHCSQLHEELVRVPLVLAGPGVPHGRRVSTPLSNRHLAPTLARVGGARLAAVRDGLDLLDTSALDALERAPRPIFLSTYNGRWDDYRETISILGVRDGPWTLHFTPAARAYGDPTDAPGRERMRLFRLDQDPEQRRDLAPSEPELAARLKELVLAEMRANDALRPVATLGAGAATRQLLRDIGYAGDDGDGH